MNSIKHFRQLQAQYMPKRLTGANINKINLAKRLLKEEQGVNFNKKLVYKSAVPRHLRKYPNFTFKPSDIINVEKRIKGKPEFDLAGKIKLQTGIYKIPNDFEDVKEPIHDALDFKQMTGNEIILNLSNCEYFRHSELINGIYEISKRMNLKVNEDVINYDIVNHPYIGKALAEAKKKMFNFKVNFKLTQVTTFDSIISSF
jgi:hypothetical protein